MNPARVPSRAARQTAKTASSPKKAASKGPTSRSRSATKTAARRKPAEPTTTRKKRETAPRPAKSAQSEAGVELRADPPTPAWESSDGRARLLSGDSLELLPRLEAESFDLIFADPPYFLSNGGSTCRNGKRTSVDKGRWDVSQGAEHNHDFNRRWLEACQRLLKPNGTIWVSGTSHVIFSVGYAMQQLGYKILNEIIWEKPNPPPNLSCRYFTHSTEIVLWAAKGTKSKHHFDYPEMKVRNGNKQMKNVWRFPAPPKREKTHGRHPTQKPLQLLERLLAAACPEQGRVLDPFNGSGTTGVASMMRGLDYTGLELDPEYLELSQRRIQAVLDDDAPALAV